MFPPALLVLSLLASIPPLTQQQRIALKTAYDGRDHRESAFVALLENINTWQSDGGGSLHRQPDLDSLLAAPDRTRGNLYRLIGQLQQQTLLNTPYEHIMEWFIRPANDRPVAVYLPRKHTGEFRSGDRIVMTARFYKRIDAVSRDGATRSYPAFVGAFPQHAPPATATNQALPRLLAIVIATVALLIVTVFLVVYIRRSRSSRRLNQSPLATDNVSARHEYQNNLPDDPARALEQLKQRNEQMGDSAGPEG